MKLNVRRAIGVGISLIVIVAVAVFVRRQNALPKECVEDHSHDHRAVHPDLEWPAADIVLQYRAHFEPALQMKGIPELDACGVDYMQTLAARRESALSYAREHPLEIVFIGWSHGTDGEGSQEARDKWLADNKKATRIVAKDPDIQAFAFEEHGSYEVLDRERMIVLYEDQLDIQSGSQSAEWGADHSVRTQFAVLRYRPDIAVIAGEECPHVMAQFLLRRLVAHKAEPDFGTDPAQNCIDMRSGEMFMRLSRLRTEIILIRTIELLRDLGAEKGAVMQGVAHTKHLPELATKYRLRIDVHDLTKDQRYTLEGS